MQLINIKRVFLLSSILLGSAPITGPTSSNAFADDPPGRFAPSSRVEWTPDAAARIGVAGKETLRTRYPGFAGRLRGGLLRILDERERSGPVAAARLAHSIGITASGDRLPVIVVPAANVNTDTMVKVLEAVGATVLRTGQRYVKAAVPILRIADLARDSERIDHVRPLAKFHMDVVSEGVAKTKANMWHTRGWTGAGVKVAVIDGDFLGLAQAKLSGEIPTNVVFIDYTGTGPEGTSPHGVGVAEIVHDIAPDAELYLMKIEDPADLAAAVDDCQSFGVKIINLSGGWYGFNFFDGVAYSSMTPSPVTIADDAVAGGILWVNAAGNDQRTHALACWADSNASTFLDWTSSGGDVNQIGQLNAGVDVDVWLTWDRWPMTDQDFDLYLVRYNGSVWEIVAESEGFQTGFEPPLERLNYQVPAGMSGSYGIAVRKYEATSSPCFIIRTPNIEIQYYGRNNSSSPAPGSITCPADAASVLTVGAIDQAVYTAGPIETYSSLGPNNGSYTGRASVPKPDVCGPDSTLSWSYGDFSGTSASSPHVAGLAALVWGKFPDYTTAQVRSYLESKGVDLGPAGRDNTYGRGPVVLPECSFNDECDDGIFCNGPEQCAVGLCAAGPPRCSGSLPVCCEAAQSCVSQCCADGDCLDNGAFCDGPELCVDGFCFSSGNPCTGDKPLCCENLDVCTGECCEDFHCSDNGIFCDGGEICALGVCTSQGNPCADPTPYCCEVDQECSAQCCEDIHCNDGNDCTADACLGGQCVTTPVLEGTVCGDDADDECTDPDTCDALGTCLANHALNGTLCSDGLFCTGPDTCEAGQCVAGPSPCTDPARPFCDEVLGQCRAGCFSDVDCNDSNPCTNNVCGDNGVCFHPPSAAGTLCGDATDNACTDPDTCNGSGQCNPNHASDSTTCSDGLFCTASDSCVGGVCRGAVSPCTNPLLPLCDETADACLPGCLSNTDCNDDNECTSDSCGATNQCQNLALTAGTPCGDTTDNACTDPDTCNGSGLCIPNHAPDGTPCPDELYCNGDETCRVGACAPAGRRCTGRLSCDEDLDRCFCQSDTDCDDGVFCNGAETCRDGECEISASPCGPGFRCDEATRTCICDSDADCDDGNACNGDETCVDGACRRGLPMTCNDGSAWTDDSCDPATSACVFPPICELLIVGPAEVTGGRQIPFAAEILWQDGRRGDVSALATWRILSAADSDEPSSLAAISTQGMLSANASTEARNEVWVEAKVRDRVGVELKASQLVAIVSALSGPTVGAPIPSQSCGYCGSLDGLSAMILLIGWIGLTVLPARRSSHGKAHGRGSSTTVRRRRGR